MDLNFQQCPHTLRLAGTGTSNRGNLSVLLLIDAIVTAFLFALYPVLQITVSAYFCLECYLSMKGICSLEISLTHEIMCPTATIAINAAAPVQQPQEDPVHKVADDFERVNNRVNAMAKRYFRRRGSAE